MIKEPIKEGQLVCVNYLADVNTGDIISTNTAYLALFYINLF